MCPACLTTMALIAASTTSTGVAAFIARRFRAPERREDHLYNSDHRRLYHDQKHD